LRQSGIDEELFDVISGYEALAAGPASGTGNQTLQGSSPSPEAKP